MVIGSKMSKCNGLQVETASKCQDLNGHPLDGNSNVRGLPSSQSLIPYNPPAAFQNANNTASQLSFASYNSVRNGRSNNGLDANTRSSPDIMQNFGGLNMNSSPYSMQGSQSLPALNQMQQLQHSMILPPPPPSSQPQHFSTYNNNRYSNSNKNNDLNYTCNYRQHGDGLQNYNSPFSSNQFPLQPYIAEVNYFQPPVSNIKDHNLGKNSNGQGNKYNYNQKMQQISPGSIITVDNTMQAPQLVGNGVEVKMDSQSPYIPCEYFSGNASGMMPFASGADVCTSLPPSSMQQNFPDFNSSAMMPSGQFNSSNPLQYVGPIGGGNGMMNSNAGGYIGGNAGGGNGVLSNMYGGNNSSARMMSYGAGNGGFGSTSSPAFSPYSNGGYNMMNSGFGYGAPFVQTTAAGKFMY